MAVILPGKDRMELTKIALKDLFSWVRENVDSGAPAYLYGRVMYMRRRHGAALGYDNDKQDSALNHLEGAGIS